jgi:anaerobic magnesium-protoporphyrin IX monomethyl ester cyclase
MKICIVVPPSNKEHIIPERVYGCTFSYYRQPELPLLYVASLLEQEGHAVTFRDFTEENSWKSFEDAVAASDHEVYVFHTVLLAESADIKAARFITEHTNASIIFFGPQPTFQPINFLLNDRCYVARGEAEYIIRDLLRGLESGPVADVKGISYLHNGQMRENDTYGVIQDLDSLPFPARQLLQERECYFNPKLEERPVTLVLTSRGCSFRCYYCVPNAISWARELEWKRYHPGKKPPVTLRSPGNIALEFETIKQQGYRAVSIIDDMFLFGGKDRVLQLCRGLEQVGLPFGGLARCDLILDEEIVSALAKAGCRYVDLGIESLDQGVLDDIKKDIDATKVESAIRLLGKYNIEPKPNIMFGASPKETRETIEHTIKTIAEYPVNYCMFAIATPFPGTAFAEMAKKEGWAIEPEIHDLENNLSPTDKSLVSYPHLTKKDLERAVKMANRRFYLSPRRVWFQLRKLRSLKALKDLISTGWKVIK